MNVLVAGATGAIGRPLVSALVSARHNVFGMTSSKLGLQTLKEDGAEGLLASALDAQCFKPGTLRLPSIVASDWRASSSSDAGADAPCTAGWEHAAVNETRAAKHRTHT